MLAVDIKHTDEQNMETSWILTWDLFFFRKIMLLLKLSTLKKEFFCIEAVP
jgi:hypothetical protein